MPIGVGANPAITIGGTTNVKIVSWDSTASIPAGTAALGAVSIIAGTATQNVLVVGQPVGISGTVTSVFAPAGTQNVLVVAQPIGISGTVSAAFAGTADVKLVAVGTTAPVNVVNTVAVSGTVTGIVAASGTQDVSIVSPLYQQGGTAIGATGTGFLVIGIQSGATTARGWAFTTSAAGQVFNVNTAGPYTVTGVGLGISGSASIINTVAISGSVTAIGLSTTASFILVGASTTAPVTIVNTAGPFTISGSASIINTVAVSGSVTAIGLATTADFFAIPTGGSVRYNGTSTNVNQLWLSITTSAAVIVVTSAANKVHIITSLWMNGNTAAAFKWQSATTDIGTLFIATSGVGMVLGHNDHGWHRTTSAQSLVASAAASGSYSGWLSYITISG